MDVRMKLVRACIRCGIEHRVGDRGARPPFITGLHKAKLMNVAPGANTQGHPNGLEPSSEHQGCRHHWWMPLEGAVRHELIAFPDSVHANALPCQGTEGTGRYILVPELVHDQGTICAGVILYVRVAT